MWPFDKFFKNNPTTENSKPQQSTWSFLSSMKRLFKREAKQENLETKQSTSFFSSPLKWYKNRKVDTALQTFRDILTKNFGSVSGKKEQVISAMLTLRNYPEILKERGMGYLIPFVDKDFDESFTKKIKTSDGMVTTKLTSLSKAIDNAIPQDIAIDYILNKTFSPLAKVNIHLPSSMAVAINHISKTNAPEEERSRQGTLAFFQTDKTNEDKAEQYTSYLQSNYPFLLPVLATKDNVETFSSIVTQAEGFSLEKYREEVRTTIDIKQQLSRMYKDGTLNDEILDSLNARAENIRQNYIDAGIMTKNTGPEREKQQNPFLSPPAKKIVRRASSSNLSPDSTPVKTTLESRRRSTSI